MCDRRFVTIIVWGLPSHEGEYVMYLPTDEIIFQVAEDLKSTLSDYAILVRGTRIEIVGEEDHKRVFDAACKIMEKFESKVEMEVYWHRRIL